MNVYEQTIIIRGKRKYVNPHAKSTLRKQYVAGQWIPALDRKTEI